MKPGKQFRLRSRGSVTLALLAVALLGPAAACSTSGTPSVAAPPVTVLSTVTATTTIKSTSTITETVTQTPTTTAPPAVLVAATFQDPANYECTDTAVDWCWALDVTTTGPCPNGAYVSLNVYKNDEDAVLTVVETTSAPVTDALGGTVTVQLSSTGQSAEGDTLKAALKEARCA